MGMAESCHGPRIGVILSPWDFHGAELIKKIAVAGRGEIAKRIISTCHRMGLETALLYSAGDEGGEAFRLARDRICIGPEDPLQSYLNIEANVEGALGAGASALHPGYGFLSESAEFAKRCEDRGLTFIGPPAEAMSLFGNKISARRACEKAGVPVLPGASGPFRNIQACLKKAESLGWPVMIKSAESGGGRGIRTARNRSELEESVPRVQSEAQSGFQSGEIFLEAYLESAKHIEIQFFVSADGEIHIFGDRDCSAQRRHQKVIEEAPADLPEQTKRDMREASLSLLKGSNYRGAGTLEFLFKDGKFFFLEVNTRLQVEHTVTEMIFGVDLVRAQILTAMGQPVFFNETPEAFGHSLQCRILAEDPFREFLPTGGPLLSCRWPSGPGVRLDTGFEAGDVISSRYDSLIAKLIVWDQSRTRAVEKMKTALAETVIFGCPVNIPFLRKILLHPSFVGSAVSTDFISKTFPKGMAPAPFPFETDFIQRILREFGQSSGAAGPSFDPWKDFLKDGK